MSERAGTDVSLALLLAGGALCNDAVGSREVVAPGDDISGAASGSSDLTSELAEQDLGTRKVIVENPPGDM